MASPRYQFRLDELRDWSRNGGHGLIASDQSVLIEDLTDRVQALAAEVLRLRRREILRMGGFDR